MTPHTYKTPCGWEAIDLDTWDGAPEGRDELIGGVKGRGETVDEAVRDLREQQE